KLEQVFLELHDHWAIVNYIWNHPEIQSDVTRQTKKLNWQQLAARAEPLAEAHATNNPFGIENSEWKTIWRRFAAQHQNDIDDQWFLSTLRLSRTWGDLALLLQTLKALGAKPLVISLPLHRTFWNYRGVSTPTLESYYHKLREVTSQAEVPTITL